MLPGLFIVLGAIALIWALIALWQSLRAALGVTDPRTLHSSTLSVERSALLDEKAALLGSIRDLRFDRDLGKMSDADHARLDKQLRRRAREVLQLLDEDVKPYRARADAIMKKHLAKLGPAMPYRDSSAAAAEPDAAVPSDEPKARPAEGAERACPECGTPNDTDAAFCKKCAARVAPRECGSCHAVNDADATFCKKCATRLEDDASPDDAEAAAADAGEPDDEASGAGDAEDGDHEPGDVEAGSANETEDEAPPRDGEGEAPR